MYLDPPRLSGSSFTTRRYNPSWQGPTTEYDRVSERPPICTVMLIWLPGVGGTNSPASSISNIRTSGARSRIERSTAARHSMGAAMARLLGGLVVGTGRRRVLLGQEPID